MANTNDAYRLAEQAQQTRLHELMQDDDSCSLRRELALARLMLEDAHRQGMHLLARDLLGSIATLSKAHQLALEKRGQLLDRVALAGFIRTLIEVNTEHLKRLLPDGWEDAANEIADAFGAAMEAKKRLAIEVTDRG